MRSDTVPHHFPLLPTMNPLTRFQQALGALPANATERSYYPAFAAFVKSHLDALHGNADIQAIVEESAREGIGFPDLTVRDKGKIVGWIEVKTPQEDLGSGRFDEQFTKYKENLENIVFTNFRQWELWQWDDKGRTGKIAEVSCDARAYDADAERSLDRLLRRFLAGHAYDARTPKQLALALARKTRLLSQQVEEHFDEEDQDSELYRLKEDFSAMLIQHISAHQFANMVAETLAYSLFLAALEHSEKHADEDFDLDRASRFLPGNVPILKDLFDLVKRVSEQLSAVKGAARLLIDQLKTADLESIRDKLIKRKPGDDPVIQFYEPFLSEYDPEERERRGVYYTPKPVVDFIVRNVDRLLETRFGKKDGLADPSVTILDPATGTGTFLMAAIQRVHERMRQEYGTVGLLREKFNAIVDSHIMRNFFGFELLVAPYVIAHLKLMLETRRLGFAPADGSARFQVFLANSLDDPESPNRRLTGFPSLSKESEQAQAIKKEKPILAIIGNPPYSGESSNKGDWIMELIEAYKKEPVAREKLREKNPKWLNDDYVKFLRFAQWKIAATGAGVVAMITNNNFLDNITFRGMRYELMRSFDEIYHINLHGSVTKKETTPDGGKDENVFNIKTGVGISFFVKKTDKPECKVFYQDLYGLRKEKFAWLSGDATRSTQWKELNPIRPHYFFTDKDFSLNEEYEKGWKIDDIFPVNSVGIVTARDNFTIQPDQATVMKTIEEFLSMSDEQARAKFHLGKDARDWKVSYARSDLKEHWPNKKGKIAKVNYRPFDERYTYYTGNSKGFHCMPRWDVMRHLLDDANIAIVASRGFHNQKAAPAFCADAIIDCRAWSSFGMQGVDYVFPLYLYENDLVEKRRKPNLSQEFVQAFSDKIGYAPAPEEMFYYAYAVLHCPAYRGRYAEQLKIDFPRLPLTGDKRLFKKLVKAGNELVNLHLLGNNPLDSNARTVFDDTSRWRVKANGAKPDNCRDWQITKVDYRQDDKRVYVNNGQYFEGIAPEVWQCVIGGYQVLDKWLKDRKKIGHCLSSADLERYLKIIVALRETGRIMETIDRQIEKWPMS